MIIAVLASDLQKEEIVQSTFFRKHEVVYSENDSLWAHHAADAFIDLRFEARQERITELAKLLPKPVLVNSVTETLDKIHPSFIRINAWPGFLKGKCLEAAAGPEAREIAARLFGEDLVFVQDSPGFVSARIVAMILNEAYFTLDQGISSKEEIDIAMKLGTGYPYGPFEWGRMIGKERVIALLECLSQSDLLYEPAEGWKQEA
jgi:3-hydroxybutyryl-CoA dehydrogenase